VAKVYLISDKQMQEEILETLDLMIEECETYYNHSKEDWETNPAYDEAKKKWGNDLPDSLASFEWYLDSFKEFKETLLALPVVETIVIKE